jgi:hypothetical protein
MATGNSDATSQPTKDGPFHMPDRPSRHTPTKLVRRGSFKPDNATLPRVTQHVGRLGVPDPPPPPDEPSNKEEMPDAAHRRREPPQWFLEEIKKGSSPEEILRVLRARVPKSSDLREAQQILNEIGRLQGGGRLVRQTLTQRLLSELARETR